MGMKNLTWRSAVVGGWMTVLALLASQHLSRPWGRPIPIHGVQLRGPAVEMGARLETKSRVAHDVFMGRTPLLAAAAVFRRLDDQSPCYAQARNGSVDSPSEAEAYCRSVIGWVAREAPPERADELTKRLQSELDAMIRDGALHLPSAGDAEPIDKPG
jgi:hypothetical protein